MIRRAASNASPRGVPPSNVLRTAFISSRKTTTFANPRAIAATVALLLAANGCGGEHTSGARTVHSNGPAPSTTTAAPIPSAKLRTASWTLPRPPARAALVADGDHLLLLGGLDGNDQTTAEVLQIDPRSGSITDVGTLTSAVHDAAGALVGRLVLVFGGGNANETAHVQSFVPGSGSRTVGQLPIRRADLAAATVGGRTFLVGGYDGSTIRASVLATTDGMKFDILGDLPVPVRYPAVAALGSEIYVVGGSNGAGGVRAVQVLDTRTGAVRTAGELPQTLTDAVAATLGEHIYVFGGTWGGEPSDQVWRLDIDA